MTKKCPYCNTSDDFIEEPKRRPDQELLQCNSCGKYFVYNIRNQQTYVLANPLDKQSPPHSNRR